MTNIHTAWINSLEGLSDEPLRRAAQIALAAIDRMLTSDDLSEPDSVFATAAYDTLQAALACSPEPKETLRWTRNYAAILRRWKAA